MSLHKKSGGAVAPRPTPKPDDASRRFYLLIDGKPFFSTDSDRQATELRDILNSDADQRIGPGPIERRAVARDMPLSKKWDSEIAKVQERDIQARKWGGEPGTEVYWWREAQRFIAVPAHAGPDLKSGYTTQEVLVLLQISNSTLNRYAKEAKVPHAGQGEQNYRYSCEDLGKIIGLMAEKASPRVKEHCRKVLPTIAENPQIDRSLSNQQPL